MMVSKKKIDKKIRKARETLRELFTKYQLEFKEINMKIDKYLEDLEDEK